MTPQTIEPDAIRAGLPGWMAAAHTPGAAVALVEPAGRETGFICAGVLGADDPRPITPETVFEAASLGKPVFARLAGQLVSEGLLDPDAPLSDFLPEPWVPGEPRLPLITARRVLGQSTGLPNWFREGQPRALAFAPGARFGYSGEGYLYLQRVIERLTGETLEDLAAQRVFGPLGMSRSAYHCPEDAGVEVALARGHDPEGKPRPKWRPDCNAGYSLHTTAADYARFLQAELAEAPARFAPQTPIDAETAWGLGWGLKRLAAGTAFWQWGDNNGWKHFAGGVPESGQGTLVLTNGEAGAQVWKEVLRRTLDPQDAIFTWLMALE